MHPPHSLARPARPVVVAQPGRELLLREHSDRFNSIKALTQQMCGSVEVSSVVDLGHVTLHTLQDARCPYAQTVHASSDVYLATAGRNPDISICCNDPNCKQLYGSRPTKIHFDDEREIAQHDAMAPVDMHPQDKYVQWDEDYDEPVMRPYPQRRIVCVRAFMGLGKTKALRHFVTANAAPDSKILIVTYSRTLAAKLFADFGAAEQGWTDYSKLKGDINNHRVIVCLDSLFRIQTRNFDYVIIDEALSVFLHFNSSLMKRSSQNCVYLELLVRQSQCTFFIDACIDQTVTTQIVHYFSQVMGVPSYWIKNRHVRDPRARSCAVKVKRGGAVGSISEAALVTEAVAKVMGLLEAGKKVVVCSSTKRFTTTLEEYVRVKRPQTTMVVCNGDTVNDLDDVNRSWKRDLLVYSPSVSAGVSFEEIHFDSLVGYFVNSNYTPSVDISLQQLYRVRNLTDGDMHLFIQDSAADRQELATTDAAVDAMLDGSVSLVNKYYISESLAAMAHQVVHDAGIHFDKTRLSYIIIKGIITMRHRSLKGYADILLHTLRNDYQVECSILDEGADGFEVELDVLEAAARKVKHVAFEDVRQLAREPQGIAEYQLLQDSLQQGRRVCDEDIAAMNLYAATTLRFRADPTKVDVAFYEDLVASGNDDYYKAKRFSAMMTESVDTLQREMSVRMRRISFICSVDSNLDIFKSKVATEYVPLLVGYKWLRLCLTEEQTRDLRDLKTVTIYAKVMDATYKQLKADLTDIERRDMLRIFDMKASSSDYIALRKVMSHAFKLDVVRQHPRSDRTGFRKIDINPSWLRSVRDRYSARLLAFDEPGAGRVGTDTFDGWLGKAHANRSLVGAVPDPTLTE